MIYAAPGALAILGLGLLILTWEEPRYSNPGWASPFDSVDISKEDGHLASQRFYAVQTENLTPASRQADLGRVLFAFGSSAVVLSFLLHHHQRNTRARDLTTPGYRGLYFLANGAWLAFVPAQWLWLDYTFDRGDYPWWSDIIAIPAVSYLMVFAALLPVVNLSTYLCARGASLPVRLLDRGVGLRAFISTGLLIVPTGLIIALGHDAYFQGDHFTTAVLPWALYAILSLRAAGASLLYITPMRPLGRVESLAPPSSQVPE